MKKVKLDTQELYDSYISATDRDEKAELKKAYSDAVQKLTLGSKQYRSLLDRFTKAMAGANDKALAIANDTMLDIYTMNYNQVADECKKVGIRVDG